MDIFKRNWTRVKNIADAINQATKYPKNTLNYTVIADDVNSIYANSNITACAIALDAE